MCLLVFSQLFYDGYHSVAVSLSNLVKSQTACPPADRLNHLVSLGLKLEGDQKEQGEEFVPSVMGIDLDFETEAHSGAPEPGSYDTAYVTSHKGLLVITFNY